MVPIVGSRIDAADLSVSLRPPFSQIGQISLVATTVKKKRHAAPELCCGLPLDFTFRFWSASLVVSLWVLHFSFRLIATPANQLPFGGHFVDSFCGLIEWISVFYCVRNRVYVAANLINLFAIDFLLLVQINSRGIRLVWDQLQLTLSKAVYGFLWLFYQGASYWYWPWEVGLFKVKWIERRNIMIAVCSRHGVLRVTGLASSCLISVTFFFIYYKCCFILYISFA